MNLSLDNGTVYYDGELSLPVAPIVWPKITPIKEVNRRKGICRTCTDRPSGCWKAREYGCVNEFRSAEAETTFRGRCPVSKWDNPETIAPAVDRTACPSCDLTVPQIRTLADVHAAVREILTRDLTPPPFREEVGIVTSGEGRYEPGIVIGIKILRDHLKCDLPLTVFHRGDWKTCLKGYDVNLVSSDDLQDAHPAKHYGGWESKTFAVMHAGYRRAMFLDGDAYLVRDPAPLFRLLDEHRLVIWYDYGPGWACGPTLDNDVCPLHHQNGGQYLVDLATYWREFQAQRFLDNHSHIWYREGRLGDECSHRLVRSLIADRGVLGADWVDRTRGVGILARYPSRGPAYVAHRMRRESKLIVGTLPNSNPQWPLESIVLKLFAEFSPEYAARKEVDRQSRTPQGRRAARARARAKERSNRKCIKTASPAAAP